MDRTVGYGRVEESTLLQLKNLQRHFFEKAEIAQFIQDNSLQSLHTGECESLYLCQQTGTTLILTDDLAVRDAAKRLKITPVGSLGVVVRAYQVRLISLSEAENYILDLQNISSLFVTRAIVDLAIKTLHSHSGKT